MSDYWKKRQEATYKAGEMKVNQYFAKLEKAFNQTKRELQKTVEAFYFRYAEENGLTFAEAQKRLDKAEIGELKDFIELSMANIGKYNQEVNNLSIKARITRYQALEMQIDAMLRELYAVAYEAEAEKTMQEVYGDTYYQTWYNIDQYRGFHSAFAQVDPTTVESLLEYPFNGANFSSRLWKQKDHLQTTLMESLTTMMVQGVPPQNLAEDFAKKMKTKRFEAYRLLHTESSFLMSEATHAGYKEDGVEKYEILATLDSKTCGICGELDGNVYLVEDAVTGKNMPPFHCFCRCTDVPYYDDTDLADQTRAARDPETGKTYEVPADMNYKEWHAEYIEKNPEKALAEKKLRNQKADKEQYDRYKRILGKDAPDSLDSFQNMKYTDGEKWAYTKGLKDYLGKYPTSDKRYYDVGEELKGTGITKAVVLPPVQKQAFILPEGKHDPYHIMHRMAERHITDDEIRSYMSNADIMLIQWGGRRQVFYGNEGVCVITKSGDDWIYKTAWKKDDFDEDTDKILEVIGKHVK